MVSIIWLKAKIFGREWKLMMEDPRVQILVVMWVLTILLLLNSIIIIPEDDWYIADAYGIALIVLKLVAIIMLSKFLLKRSSKLFTKVHARRLELMITYLGFLSLLGLLVIIGIYIYRVFRVYHITNQDQQ